MMTCAAVMASSMATDQPFRPDASNMSLACPRQVLPFFDLTLERCLVEYVSHHFTFTHSGLFANGLRVMYIPSAVSQM